MDLCLLLGVLVAGVAVGWQLRFPDVLTGGDDITNLLLARSIANGGYRDLFLAGAPPHVHYPPVMPLWIWLLVEIGGGSLAAVQAANLALLALVALCLADGFRRLGEKALGLVGATLVMLNPMLLGHAGTALAEILLLALSTIAIWAMLRSREPQAPVGRWQTIAFLAGVGAFGAKTIGLATLAAVVAGMALRHRRRAVVFGLAAAAVAMLWFGYVRIAGTRAISYSYLADLTVVPAGGGLAVLWSRIFGHARYYLQDGLPDVLGLFMVPGTPVDNLAWTAILLPSGIAGAWWLRRRWPDVPLLIGATVPILLLWPWAMARLAVPLIPAGLACLLPGARQLGHSVNARHGGLVATIVVGGALGLSTVSATFTQWVDLTICPRHDVYAVPSPCTVPAERALVSASRQLGAALPESAVILTSKPKVVYWFGGLRAVPTRAVENTPAETLSVRLEELGVSHVLLTGMHPSEYGRIANLFEKQCVHFEALPAMPDGVVLLTPRTPDQPDACQAIRAYRSQVSVAP